ncbi:choline ABC transporter ATP-binding protein [Salipaludibacillus keqinensis]|uniref:Quaternary amine transport ATP-binding protein n=1 Tax=Salipaludibacillus keqinensis TaxID=2045207 RepID=A0A323TJP9_9BACI|nr:ABC transporter ATP-binding protein [Salipaludibacillus keqinensis]PYZ95211.1 choline ABC transporter ATP-binding protein [Salipaludibacillus keqinensis]
MIKFTNVSKIFPDGTKAVNDISFDVEEGEFFVIIGPSGCGKTTTMKMINRLIDSSKGSIHIQNKNILEMNIKKLRWNIGYVLQQIALFPHMSIKENIAIVPELKKWSNKDIHKRVDELLNMVGLDPDTYRDRKPSELSGGQQQRIGVIRALAGNPDIILMDEPFSALDPISRDQLQKDIQSLQKEIKKTIVFVTHDIDEALALGSRICVMKDGEVVQIDTPEKLLKKPANDFVREFLGERQDPWADEVSELLPASSPESNHETHEGPYVAYTASIREALERLKESNADSIPVYDEKDYKGQIGYKDITLYLEQSNTSVKGGDSA